MKTVRNFLLALTIGSCFPMPSFAEIATLQDALIGAYKNNPELEGDRQGLKAKDERVSQAISGFRPNLSLSGEKGRERTSMSGAAYTEADRDSRSVQLVQPLFSGFGSVNSYLMAENQVKAEKAALMGSEQNILVAAATAYADVIRTRSLVELSKKNEEVLTKHMQATKDRFSVGEVTRTDVAQSESRLATATADRVQAEANETIAESTFERIIGEKPAAELSADIPQFDLPATVDEALKISQSDNPGLIQKDNSEKAAEYNINVQKSQLLPSLNLRGTMSRVNTPQFGSTKYRDDSVVLALNVPLYDSGLAYSKTREAKAQHQQAKFDVMDTSNRVREAVIKGWEQWQASISNIDSSKKAVEAATIAVDGVQQEYLYGSRTTLDVLDTEQELFQAQTSLVTATRNESVARFNLASLLGRFDAKTLKLPVSIYNPDQYYDNNKYKMLGF